MSVPLILSNSTIPDYATLKSVIADYLDRSDLTSQIPVFIDLAEQEFAETLWIPERERVYQVPLVDGYALPQDFWAMRSITLVDDDDTPLEQVTFPALKRECEYEDRPVRFAESGGKLYFAPQPETDYTMEIAYYADVPQLGDNNASNWLLAKRSRLYLYGALVQACAFLDANDSRIVIWNAALQSALEAARQTGIKRRYGAATLVMRRA